MAHWGASYQNHKTSDGIILSGDLVSSDSLNIDDLPQFSSTSGITLKSGETIHDFNHTWLDPHNITIGDPCYDKISVGSDATGYLYMQDGSLVYKDPNGKETDLVNKPDPAASVTLSVLLSLLLCVPGAAARDLSESLRWTTCRWQGRLLSALLCVVIWFTFFDLTTVLEIVGK